ncbi:hypothetical protein NL676_028718 [Syzygium grande]|nr:hypothetical protein NL676_028718 [Syzygium grande]
MPPLPPPPPLSPRRRRSRRFRCQVPEAPSFVDPFATDSATASTSGRRGSFAVRAARGKFERKKPRVNIWTIGPVDRGKSTLTAAPHQGVGLHGKQRYHH